MLPEIEVPKPDVDAGDGVSWMEKAGDWVSGLSPDAWKLILIGVAAALIVWAFRRSPMLKGVAIGVVLLAIVLAIAT